MTVRNQATKVNWKMSGGESPILYRNRVRLPGFDIFHWRILAGELSGEPRQAHEINIALSGAVTTRNHTATGGTRKNVHQPGSICLIPVGQSAKAIWETEIECLRIAFDPIFVKRAAIEQNLSGEFELIETYNRSDAVIQHLALALLGEASACEPVGLMYAESLTNTLILHLLKNYSTAGRKPDNLSGGLSGYRLRRALEFINEHLEKELSLRQIAEATGFSQFHFAREFRRSIGLTPQQYLIQQRISRAKELLVKSDLPLIEVAASAGFKNQSHFTSLFRKFTALTPKAYREIKHQ